jgi:hypothetical protein
MSNGGDWNETVRQQMTPEEIQLMAAKIQTAYRSLGLDSYAKGASSRRDEIRGRDHQ